MDNDLVKKVRHKAWEVVHNSGDVYVSELSVGINAPWEEVREILDDMVASGRLYNLGGKILH
jgi:hypothetical protein